MMRVIKPCTDLIQVMDVPRLKDSSTGGGLSELDGAIVINLANCVWSRILGWPMLAIGVLFDHDFVTNATDMINAFCVFSCIVLEDKLLVSFLDALPVWLEGDVDKCVPLERKLRWRCPQRSVNSGVHYTTYFGKHSCIIVIL